METEMDNEKQLLYESKGIDIYDHIQDLATDEKSARRWVWELLQNAVDISVDSQEGVSVKYELNDEFASFFHNGLTFDEPSLNHLFFKKSQKRDKIPGEKTIGNFGTGFLTTHLLSKIVEINGLYQKKNQEHTKMEGVLLDRSGNEHDIVKALIQYSKKRDALELQESVQYNFKNIENTNFKYIFNPTEPGGKTTGEKGIIDLKNSLVFAMEFISQIKPLKEVQVVNDVDTDEGKVRNTDHFFLDKDSENIGKIILKTIHQNGQESFLALLTKDDSSIAMQVKLDSDEKLILQSKSTDTPNLFKVFPLIGSESFGFPAIINSLDFIPNKEREGIILSGGEQVEEMKVKNQNVLLDIVQLYLTFIDEISLNGLAKWTNHKELARIKMPSIETKMVDRDWHKTNVLLPIRQKLLVSSIVEREGVLSTINLGEAKIPTVLHLKEEKILAFWDLCAPIMQDKIPKRTDIVEWNKIISADYEDWKDETGKKVDLKFDLECLLREIVSHCDINTIKEKFDNNIEKTFKWLNDVIGYTETEQPELLTDPLKNIEIIPNQKPEGSFKFKGKLFKDEDIPDDLKDVLLTLNPKADWRSDLMSNRITTCILPNTQIRSVEIISSEIDKVIENKDSVQTVVRNGVNQLIGYYANTETIIPDWRKKIRNFAFDLDNSVPELKPLSINYSTLWDKSDEWLLKTMVKDIKAELNTEKLRVKLNKATTVDSVLWLNEFIGFYRTNKRETAYFDQEIFPNQNGNLIKKNECLYFDNNIPEKLKDIRKIIIGNGIKDVIDDWRDRLLDKSIVGFEKHNPQSVADLSDSIDRIIAIKLKEQVLDLLFVKGMFQIVSVLSTNYDHDRKTLWSIAQRLFPIDIESEPTIISESSDFNYSVVNSWILNQSIQAIENCGNTFTLAKVNPIFHSEGFENCIIWLDKFITFVISFEEGKYKNLLEKYAIIPNQQTNSKVESKNEKFCLITELHMDLYSKEQPNKTEFRIPKDLKDILALLSPGNDWRNELVRDGMGVKLEKIHDTKEICGLIDDIVIKLDSKSLSDAEKLAIEKLIDWTENEEYGGMFKLFYTHRTNYYMDISGTKEDRQKVFKIMRSGQLDAISSIVNSGISNEDLTKVADNLDDIRLMLENPADFQRYLKYRRNKVDDESHANEETGDFGEDIIYNDLLKKFPQEGRVKWPKEREYDFVVMTENLNEVQFYIDAKTTIRGFANQDSIPFYIRTKQWIFLEEEKSKGKYFIARVWGSEDEVRYLKIELTSIIN